MSEYKMIHDILQRIDDDLIEEAIYTKREHYNMKKFATAAAVILICAFLSVGVAASISTTFREWLMEQFKSEIVPDITKLEMPDGIHRIENGFLIQEEGTTENVYRIKEKEIVLCDSNVLQGTVTYEGKSCDYFLCYVKDGKEVYGHHYDGAALRLCGYDETTGILEMKIDDISMSYFIDYLSGTLTPFVEGYDMHVSAEGTYLLYRSKRENIEKWYVQNLKSREEMKLEGVSCYLHSDEIGFLDDSHISISWYGDALHSEQCEPAIYDCNTKELKKLGTMLGGNYGFTQIYEIISEQGDYEFVDLYLDETYRISRSQGAKISSSYATRNIICLQENTGRLKVYLIREKQALDFEQMDFSDLEEVMGMHDLGNNQFLIEGIEKNKQVGYLLEFPELMKETIYRCHVSYPEQDEQIDIMLTEEEIKEVLSMIVNSESEILSSQNGNIGYEKKEKLSVYLMMENEVYEFCYRLTIAEKDILTYSIKKKSLYANNETEKKYVIYSKKLYDYVLEKIGGVTDEK